MAHADTHKKASEGAGEGADTDAPGFVDRLEAVFAAVITKARADPAFARQLATAAGDPTRFAAAARATRRTDWAAEAPDLNPAAMLAAEGEEALRAALKPLTKRALYALVKSRALNPAGASAFNKLQLVEHIIRSVRRRSDAPVFDY